MDLRSVIIPAAGLGTRLLPATKSVPKEMLNVYDRPVMQFAIDEAIAAGAQRIVVVIHPAKLAIREYLRPDAGYIGKLRAAGKAALGAALAAVQLPAKVDLVFALQDAPLGLGHAVLCASDLVLGGPVGVILPDDVIMGQTCMAEMARAYVGGHLVAAMPVPVQDAARYGIFKPLGAPNGSMILASTIVEKPKLGAEPSLLAAVGRYILDPSIFVTLRNLSCGAGGEIQLTDAIAADAARMTLTAFRFTGRRCDCGSHDGLMDAALARQRQVKQESSIFAPELRGLRFSNARSDALPASPRQNTQTRTAREASV